MKDCSVYARKGRPVYYLSYWSAEKLSRVHEATPFRVDDPEGKRRAYELAQERAKEAAVFRDTEATERWESWVPDFLKRKYGARQQKTLKRYQASWKWLFLYLQEIKVYGPRSLTPVQVRDYHAWRMQQKKRTGRTVGHNTALLDIKCLQVLMQEAILRSWVRTNPCDRLGIGRLRGREKLEMPDEDMAFITDKLDEFSKENPEHYGWMRTAWEIARWQGCRVSETRINLRQQVNLRDGILTIYGKGRDGQAKEIRTLIHPALKPLFQQMLKEGKQWTLEIPKMYGRDLWRFFQKIGMPHYSFHCTRVTVITKAARAGVPENHLMAYVGHGKTDVHRVYQKLKARDLQGVAQAIAYGA